jgi:hypothetical protein
MNEITLLNLGFQALALSALGWITLRSGIKDARHRAWTALLVLFTTAVLPLALLAFPIPSAPPVQFESSAKSSPSSLNWKIHLDPTPVQTNPSVSGAPSSALIFTDFSWARLLAGSWLTISLVLASHRTFRLWKTYRWRQTLRRLTDEESLTLSALTSPEKLRVSETGQGPCLSGCFHPLIVVPAEAFQSWTPERWRWMLAHEGEHRRSGDTWISEWLGLLTVWQWWNPFVHALVSQWEQAREEICDATALSGQSHHATAYSSFLLDLVANHRQPHLQTLSMATSRPARRMRRRLEALLEQRPVAPRLHPAFIAAALLLTSLAGLTVRTLGVEPTSPTTPKTTGELETRAFKLPPNFDGANNAKDWLSKLGVVFPEGSSAVYNPTTSQLITRNTSDALNQTAELLKKWQAGVEFGEVQVYLTTKWIEMPANPSPDDPLARELTRLGPLLTDSQLQAVIRALSQTKDVDLLTAPSVTTRDGQQATVEVLREVYVSPSGREDFAGIRCDLTATIQKTANRQNGQIEVMASADMGVAFQDGKRLKDWKAMTSSSLKILHLYATKTATLNDGETLLIPIGNAEPDRQVMLFVTAALIRPTGQKLALGQLHQLASAATNAPPHQPVAATPKKPIRILAKILEATEAEALKAILPMPLTDASPNAGAPSAIAPTNTLPPPGALAMGGVMSSDQFTALVKDLKQDSRVRVTDVPVERVITGEATLARINADQVLQVTPTIGTDGRTIDLNLHLIKQDEKPGMTTTVTIWSGQTVILSGIIAVDESGKPTHSRAISITAEIE